MARVKQPLYSFHAQGKVGPIHYSHHQYRDYAYTDNPTKVLDPTEAQKKRQAVFASYASYWPLLDDPTRGIFEYMARHYDAYHKKDCKPSRWTAFLWYMHEANQHTTPEGDALTVFALVALFASLFPWLIFL